MFTRNEELRNYVVDAPGINRTILNVMALVGFLLFLFGFNIWWLTMGYIYYSLWKIKWGLAYVISFMSSVIVWKFILISEPAAILLVLAVCVEGWVHTNMILSRYQSAARQRITDIDTQGESGIDALLEKGVLLNKPLGESSKAVSILVNALRMPGGDPFLLNLAGAAMTDNKLWKEADNFYDRALTSTKDEALIRKIEQNRNLNKRRVKLNLLFIKIYHKAGET